MGREIFVDEEESQSGDGMAALISQIKCIPPQEIGLFFRTLLSQMSMTSREAVSELIWTSLTLGQQGAFEMPTNTNRWSERQITRALGRAFANPRTEITTLLPGLRRRPEDTILEDQFFTLLRNAIIRSERNHSFD